jgi:hypothetical protein
MGKEPIKTLAKKKRSVGLTVICAISIFVVYGYLNNKQHIELFNANKCYTIGKVTKFESLYKAGSGFVYEFNAKGKKYSGRHNRAIKNAPFQDKKFIVVYRCDNPEYSTILIFPRDFEAHNEIFPDSMKWVLPYSD